MRNNILLAVVVGSVASSGALGCADATSAPPPPPSSPTPAPVVQSDPFASHALEGCFTLYDMTANKTVEVVRPDLCSKRISPCSTFKIFNAMAGLETGVVQDEKTVFKWDGVAGSRPEVDHDFDLAGAMRESVVWYFQRIAAGVGMERMQSFIDRAGYGNRDLSGGLTQFWLESSLTVSPDEERAFLVRLYRDDPSLPFSARSRAIDRKILVLSNENGVELSGKTGSGSTDKEGVSLGWFVGHVKSPKGEWVFALDALGKDVNGPRVVKPIALEALKARGIL